MDRAKVKESIRKAISQHQKVKLEKVSEDDNSLFIKEFALDSLDLIELVMEVEDDLNVGIPDPPDGKKTMTGILRGVVVPEVKRRVKATFKGRGKRFRTIALPQVRVVSTPTALDVMGEVFPRVGFMGSFETGKERVVKKGKYFRVPLSGAREGLVGREELGRDRGSGSLGAKTFIRKTRKGNLVIFRRNFGADITPIFVLKKKLKTPKLPFLDPAATASAPRVADKLGDAYVTAMGGR